MAGAGAGVLPVKRRSGKPRQIKALGVAAMACAEAASSARTVCWNMANTTVAASKIQCFTVVLFLTVKPAGCERQLVRSVDE